MTAKDARVLIVDDEEKIRSILAAVLAAEGYATATARDGIEALERATVFHPDVMIVDLQMPRMDGIETIVRCKERFPHVPAVILTAHGSIQSAVEAIRKGAYDYLTKPFDNEQLLMVVRRAAELAELSGEVRRLKERLEPRRGLGAILGDGALMQDVRAQIRKMASADATVLITGESGTGKELAARAIHAESARRLGPMVVVDCTALPEQLVESAFFGHEKGAFTDATEQTTGAFGEADGGTVFLDEIGDLPPGAQAKLLRVIQEREFSRVGSARPLRVDVRVIAATNKDLESRVRAGSFREDLFYRLNVLTLRMPPLREHTEDIPAYAVHFASAFSGVFGRTLTGISDDALRALQARPWKGNVRELANVIQRGLLNAAGARIESVDLGIAPAGGSPAGWSPAEGLEAYVQSVTEQTERKVILEMLGRTGWNRTLTAQNLRISRKTLFNKMQLYGLEEPAGD
ncbi:MAG TPA: sigma-54 dependent transcriptional regulator [Bacteroidota bacterium]|nr:sigma-54 dependent transcriptional regulator [Bacteroidota bacterium]